MSIFTPLSGSNIRMNYRYLSYLVEIVIFLSDAVADLCISYSLLFPNIKIKIKIKKLYLTSRF